MRIEEVGGEARSWTYSERFACTEHGASLAGAGAADLLVQLAARRVRGVHRASASRQEVDPELVVDPERSLRGGALLPWSDRTTDYYELLLEAVADEHGIDLDVPFARAAAEDQRDLLVNGPGGRGERVQIGKRRKRRAAATRRGSRGSRG